MRARMSIVWTAGLCLLAAPASPQEFRGTVQGRVTDAQQAAVPGASIVVTSAKTGVSSEARSETDGAYVVPFLIPGLYRIDVSLPGFQKIARTGVTVAIGQKVTVDFQLKVGDLAETVEVRGDASLLDTATGGLGQVIDRRGVESLPLNGRMIFMLNRTAPGVNWQVPGFGAQGSSGLRPFDNLGGSAWSLNGGRVGTNEFLLDGAPDSTRGRYNFAPPVDAVEEFKIQTNTYDAQYGRTGGGVVNMTLKTGTNELHGQIWEFFKDEVFNANNSLNNAREQPRPSYVAHQFGATVTGPIRKNQTFFMVTLEGLRERVPFPITTSVPTEAERRGDFRQSYTDQGTPLVVYDPLTTRPDPNAPGRFIRDQIQCNGVLNVICPDRIDPRGRALLDLYPLPNVAGQRLNNFVNPVNKARYDYQAELLRLDHHFSTGSRVFLSAHHNSRDEFRSNNGLQGTFANQGEWPQIRTNYGATVDWVKTVGGKGIVNTRASYTRFSQQNQYSDLKALDRASLGFDSLPGRYMPRLDLEQYAGIGLLGDDGFPTFDKTASVQANYTRMFARHSLKAGGELRYIMATPQTAGDANGYFNFTRAFTRRDPNTADATSGNSVASLLLGYPGPGSAVRAGQGRDQHWNVFAFFIQDDVRVTPKLALNLGLRWDYESGTVDAQNRLVRGFAFDQTNPLADRVKGAPGAGECAGCANLRGGLLFAGVGGVPRALADPDRNNIQPRVGFAYSIDSKTVLRGGYGLYYRYRDNLGPQTGFFTSTPYIVGDISGRVGVPETKLNTFANPFPNGLAEAPGASAGLLTQVGQGISFDDPASKVPYIHQWNLTAQREITRDLMVELSYVGSHTGALGVGRNINAIGAADLARGPSYLQQTVPNPFAGLLPGSSFGGATVQRQQLLRPYPQFADITENQVSLGTSRYDAAQLTLRKRFSGGLTFTAAYAYSRVKEKTGYRNAQDTELFEQVANYDRPHVLVLSGVYELPFGSGKPIGRDSRGLAEVLIGGWQIQWIFNWQSGRPIDLAGNTVNSLDLLRSPRIDNPTFDRWFNTCYLDTAGVRQKCAGDEEPAWQQRPAFTLRTLPARLDDIRVPWKPTVDASLFKNVRIRERYRLELGIEAFNLLNTVIFQPPNTDFTSANFGKIPIPREPIYFPRNVQLRGKVYF